MKLSRQLKMKTELKAKQVQLGLFSLFLINDTTQANKI